MKHSPEITSIVCRPHCRFFRPGEKEELSCQGYKFLAQRMRPDGEAMRAAREMARKEAPPSIFEHDPRIESVLCASCDFREEDCDFMGGMDLPDAVPCGGYVLLKRLMREGVTEVSEWLEDARMDRGWPI